MDLRITLKFLKSIPSTELAVRLPLSMQVFEVADQDYSSNNSIETIICLIVPSNTTQLITFELLSPVRRVVMGCTDLSFEVTDKNLSLQIPALTANNDRTADMHMIIPFPGVELRLEVAGENRQAGKYADTPYPLAARIAATTVEFALLEAIQSLGLDQDIGLGPCGPIYLMGFDTNNPCGHTDWPPHVHLHMARPAYGAPVGHYYFDSGYTFSHNIMDLRKLKTELVQFDRGVACPHHAPDGSVLFDLMITETGGFRLTSANNSALIEPNGSGFDTGAIVTVDTLVKRIAVEINNTLATICVSRDDVTTDYSFDPDTGAYLKHANNITPTNALFADQLTHKLNSES